MAYFSNGSEGEVFDVECRKCSLGDKACPIFIVQSTYNYDACNNKTARAILDDLVKQEKEKPWRYLGCQMKPLIEQAQKGGE